MFEYRVLRKISGRKRYQVTRENYTTKRFIICNSLQILFGRKNQEHLDEQRMYGGEAMCIENFDAET